MIPPRFRSTAGPARRRRPCPIPCPPFDAAAVWALLDSATGSPWWLTWSVALLVSTLARLLCRQIRHRTDTTVRPETGQESSSAPAPPSTLSTPEENDPTDA